MVSPLPTRHGGGHGRQRLIWQENNYSAADIPWGIQWRGGKHSTHTDAITLWTYDQVTFHGTYLGTRNSKKKMPWNRPHNSNRIPHQSLLFPQVSIAWSIWLGDKLWGTVKEYRTTGFPSWRITQRNQYGNLPVNSVSRSNRRPLRRNKTTQLQPKYNHNLPPILKTWKIMWLETRSLWRTW